MKAFSGDYLATPFNKLALEIAGNGGPRFAPAALRYIINSGINADSVYTGMYTYEHLNQNLTAFYNPTMTDEERNLLSKLADIAKNYAEAWLPDHYKWLVKYLTL